MLLAGKNAIVTGARTGIGLAVVERFAHEGANIWAVVHREDIAWLAQMEALSTECHVWIRPIYMDLGDELSIAAGMKQIISEKLPIDVLVNAAGIVSPNRLIQMTALDEMRRVMQVNFLAAVQLSQLASRVMTRQKKGSIINIASIAAEHVDLGQLEYDASKAALISATRKMAKEWGGAGIRVNAVSPGVTETKMIEGMDDSLRQFVESHTALRHLGQAKEIANTCLFLASGMGSYISGQNIRVDGGL